MKTRNAICAMLALGFTTAFAVPATAFDCFEAPTFREVARVFGVGLGPGYHNQPCPKYAAREYNKMLYGQQYPGCLAVQRSRLAGKVPNGSRRLIFPGEDGTPPCRNCSPTPAWMNSIHTRPNVDSGIATPGTPEPSPADDADEPAAQTEANPSNKTGKQQLDTPFGAPELDPPEPAPEQDKRSIEELLEGIREGDEAGQMKSDFVPGEELQKHLTPETERIYQREFPNRQLEAAPPSSERSSLRPRTSSRW